MKLLYTHENLTLVGNVHASLENAGIESLIKNDMLQAGRGELGVFDTWPEVWVVNETDYDRAVKILSEIQSPADLPDWACPSCGEINGAAFALCWHCQFERPSQENS